MFPNERVLPSDKWVQLLMRVSSRYFEVDIEVPVIVFQGSCNGTPASFVLALFIKTGDVYSLADTTRPSPDMCSVSALGSQEAPLVRGGVADFFFQKVSLGAP